MNTFAKFIQSLKLYARQCSIQSLKILLYTSTKQYKPQNNKHDQISTAGGQGWTVLQNIALQTTTKPPLIHLFNYALECQNLRSGMFVSSNTRYNFQIQQDKKKGGLVAPLYIKTSFIYLLITISFLNTILSPDFIRR